MLISFVELKKKPWFQFALGAGAFVVLALVVVGVILFRVGKLGGISKEERVVKNQAETVLKRVLKGEEFEALAKEFGSDGTKDAGGDLGWFGKGAMVPEFEAAAYSLQPGEISKKLVKTQFGYHIIKVVDRRKSRDFTRFMDGELRAADISIRPKLHNPFAPPNAAGATGTQAVAFPNIRVADMGREFVASVNGERIAYADYQKDIKTLRAFYAEQPAGFPTFTDEQVSDQVLSRLIVNRIVAGISAKYDIAVTDSDIGAVKANLLAQYPNEAAAEKELKEKYGWTLDMYTEKIIRPLVLEQKLTEAFPTINDPALAAYNGEDEVRASHILFKVDKPAVATNK